MGLITRGRLINKFVAVIYRLDTAASAAVVGGGYDKEFEELLPVNNGTQTGASSRREMSALRLPVQLDRKSWGNYQARRGGKEIEADIVLCFHWPDLEKFGLLNAGGEPVLKAGDRIEKIETLKGDVESTFANPPGMYFRDLERAGHGLAPFGTPRTNLLLVFCQYGKVAGAR